MKKLSVFLLSLLLIFVLFSCDFFKKNTNDSSETSTETTTEEFLDMPLARNILSQAISLTKRQTNAQSTVQMTESYYDDSSNEEINVSYSCELVKTGTGDNTVLKLSIYDNAPNHYISSDCWWFYKSENNYYQVYKSIYDDANESTRTKNYGFIDKDTFRNITSDNTYTLLLPMYYILDLENTIENDSSSFIGKKITTGNNIKYSFRIMIDPKYSSSSSDNDKIDITFFVESDLISSIDCHMTGYESYRQSYTLDCTFTVTYGITEIPLPNLNEYHYDGE